MSRSLESESSNSAPQVLYQMPTLEEILPRFAKAKVFRTLDAKDGFYQIGLDKEE